MGSGGPQQVDWPASGKVGSHRAGWDWSYSGRLGEKTVEANTWGQVTS